MNRQIVRYIALLQIGLILFTGCHPTQPFFVAEDGDLSHYLATATEIEYPDVNVDPLPEASLAMEPLTVRNQDYEFWDLTLEDCISMALANSKIIRALPGAAFETGDIATAVLGTPGSQLASSYDPALVSTAANPQPRVVDQQGNRPLPRGAARANQVGGIEDALSEFDAQYSSFINFATTDRQRNTGTNAFTPPIFTARDTTYQSAISKRLATGGVASARSQTVYSANNVLAGPFSIARAFPSDYTQTFEVQVQHPLLRNRGTFINRIPIHLARINEDIALAQYEERVRNLVKDVEIAYWDLYFSYWNVETARLGRDSARDAYVYSIGRPGQQAPFLIAEPETQVHNFESQLKSAFAGTPGPGSEAGLLSIERRLRYVMGLSPTDGRLVRPSDEPTVARVDFDWQSVLAEAMTRSVHIRTQKWSVLERRAELASAKNQLLPDFNVSGLYRWVGVGDTLFDRDNSGGLFPVSPTSAFQALGSGNFQEVGIRLEFNPNAFGARAAKALVRNAQLQLNKELAALEEKEIALATTLSEAINNTYHQYARMTIKMNEWSAADRLVTGYEAKIEDGDSDLQNTVFQLLRAQQSRANAQRDYYRAVSEYNKGLVQVHMLKESLLEYNNVTLGEGPWVEKAYWDATERARERDAATFLPSGASRPNVISQGPYNQMMGKTGALGNSGFGSGAASGELDGSFMSDPTGPDSMDILNEGDGNRSLLEQIPAPLNNVEEIPPVPRASDATPSNAPESGANGNLPNSSGQDDQDIFFRPNSDGIRLGGAVGSGVNRQAASANDWTSRRMPPIVSANTRRNENSVQQASMEASSITDANNGVRSAEYTRPTDSRRQTIGNQHPVNTLRK